MKELEWNVFVENINRRQIEIYNIFNHGSFKKDCDEAWREYKNSFQKFAENVKRSLMYYFWSKCEWEIILSDFPPSKKFQEKKVDVYEQVMLNWDRFIRYLFEAYANNMFKERIN